MSSAPLIYYNRNRLSIEATWKYLLICSVGIALAMLGILFVAYAALHGGSPGQPAARRPAAPAPRPFPGPGCTPASSFCWSASAPRWGWRPCTPGSPTPTARRPALVGALLAGGLTSVAFLAILRGVQIMAAAGDLALARQALLAMGLLSLVLAAVFMVRQPDVKRLLAYSSVENMGILAIGVGIGGLADLRRHVPPGQQRPDQGGPLSLRRQHPARLLEQAPRGSARRPLPGARLSAGLFLAGFLAITGSPPFGPFLSEFTILRGIFGAGHPVIGGVFLLLLAVVFVGMGGTVLSVTQGGEPDELPDSGYRDSLLMVGPPLLLLLLVLVLGLYLPAPMQAFLQRAASLVEVAR